MEARDSSFPFSFFGTKLYHNKINRTILTNTMFGLGNYEKMKNANTIYGSRNLEGQKENGMNKITTDEVREKRKRKVEEKENDRRK